MVRFEPAAAIFYLMVVAHKLNVHGGQLMAKHYHFDVARWEGEGGASDETPASPTTRLVDVAGRKKPGRAFLQILCGVVILVGSVAFARRKGWI